MLWFLPFPVPASVNQVRGPGVPVNATSALPVLNIDIAPTIVDLITGSIPDDMDGQSFAAVLRGEVSLSHQAANICARSPPPISLKSSGSLATPFRRPPPAGAQIL